MPRKLKIFTAGNEKHLAAIVVHNNHLDTILIKQLSDENTAVIEIMYREMKTIIVNLYFVITRHIDSDLRKIENIQQYGKCAGALIAVDSKSRSSLWHDIITNEEAGIWRNSS